MRSRPFRLVYVPLVSALCAACGDDGASNDSAIKAPAVVTFEVAGDEQFKVELVTQELVDHAQQLLDGANISAIPLGSVVRNDQGVNAPWSWHLDPETVSFAFVTIEVCDGIPSLVENETVTSPDYCPWSAKVIALENKPST